jgi:hypothetical protein
VARLTRAHVARLWRWSNRGDCAVSISRHVTGTAESSSHAALARTRAAKSLGDVADFVVISRAAQSVRGVAIVVERQRRRSSRICGGWREDAISILTVPSAAEIRSRAARARTLAAAITPFAAALLVTGRRAAFAVERVGAGVIYGAQIASAGSRGAICSRDDVVSFAMVYFLHA